MDILIKIGRNAGRVMDVEPVAALAMLDDGRAEVPCADQIPAAVAPPAGESGGPLFAAAQSQDPAAHPRRHKKGSAGK